jgi:hypothetical protein
VTEVVGWAMLGATYLLIAAGLVVGAFNLHRDRLWIKRKRQARHVRTLERELDVEPYPWGPLDG